MDVFSERLEQLASTSDISSAELYGTKTESKYGKKRIYHIESDCEKLRTSTPKSFPMSWGRVQALCEACLFDLLNTSNDFATRRIVALHYLKIAVINQQIVASSVERENISDTAAALALSTAKAAASFGFNDIKTLAEDLTAEVRKFTGADSLSETELYSAELACAMMVVKETYPFTKEQHAIFGRLETLTNLATSFGGAVAKGATKETLIKDSALYAEKAAGAKPYYFNQVPARVLPAPPDVSLQDWAVTCWVNARNEIAAELAAIWYDQAVLRLSTSSRKTMLINSVYLSGPLQVTSALGIVECGRYMRVVPNVAESTVEYIRLHLRKHVKFGVTAATSETVYETAVGLYDPRSGGKLSKLSAALEAAKLC